MEERKLFWSLKVGAFEVKWEEWAAGKKRPSKRLIVHINKWLWGSLEHTCAEWLLLRE